jgi:hypothetical protein
MQFIPRPGFRPDPGTGAEVKLIHAAQARFPVVVTPHEIFQTVLQDRTHGRTVPQRQFPCFIQEVRVDFDSEVGHSFALF